MSDAWGDLNEAAGDMLAHAIGQESVNDRKSLFHKDAIIIMGGWGAEAEGWYGQCDIDDCENVAWMSGGDRHGSGQWCRQHSLKDVQQQVARFTEPTRFDDDHA